MRRAARVDENLAEIVDAARMMGFLIYVNNNALCDIVAQWKDGRTQLWEVKTEKGKFTPSQKDMRADGWKIRTIRSVDDVLAARNEITFGREN